MTEEDLDRIEAELGVVLPPPTGTSELAADLRAHVEDLFAEYRSWEDDA